MKQCIMGYMKFPPLAESTESLIQNIVAKSRQFDAA